MHSYISVMFPLYFRYISVVFPLYFRWIFVTHPAKHTDSTLGSLPQSLCQFYQVFLSQSNNLQVSPRHMTARLVLSHGDRQHILT